MNRQENLRHIYSEAILSEQFSIRREDDYPKDLFSSLRFKPNKFRIRAIEIWDCEEEPFFRVYYAPQMADEIKEELKKINGFFRNYVYASDYKGDYIEIAKALLAVINSDISIAAAKTHKVIARGNGYEGLELPDVDVNDNQVLGRTFSWKEIIAIYQDNSSNNILKEVLSQSGVYLQRSSDGKSRYIGSAYGDGGIIGRWIKHLGSNGDAKHLNFFVLEYGYNNILFTILEFTSIEDARTTEARWKSTLGTYNNGPYDGLRLNCN